MILKTLLFAFVLLTFSTRYLASANFVISNTNDSTLIIRNNRNQTKSTKRFVFNLFPKIKLLQKKNTKKRTKNKLVASALALTLGPFGVHRLYLGTDPKVPIAYTLTLGGGFFILPLIDIFYILLSRNPEDIENNNHVFIWNKKKTEENKKSHP